MKYPKIYAQAIILKEGDKRWGGVRFTFNPKDIKGKKYVIEEKDHNSKFLTKILNEIFIGDMRYFGIRCKNIMNKMKLNEKLEEVNKDVSNNSNTS